MRPVICRLRRKGVALLCIQMLTLPPAMAQQVPGGSGASSGSTNNGTTVFTPEVQPELPIEVETELAPAASLKQAPLWHELAQILEDPSVISCPLEDDPATPGTDESAHCVANIARRPSFTSRPLPPLNVWSPCFNVLTGQPLRLRTTDGEISWDQPGLLFGPDDGDPLTPITDVIGRLVVDGENNLVVERNSGVTDDELPPTGTVVAVPGCNAAGQPVDIDGTVITEFELPITELDFFRPTTDTAGVLAGQTRFIGRPAAQALGKALFWDMQVGSDGVQACGTCHFHASVDNRTKNQLNPNHLGGDFTLQVHSGPNQDLVASDFPFRRLSNLDGPSESPASGGTIVSHAVRDSNDVMSSMGVIFRKFGDIPTPGATAFGPPSVVGAVRPLLPDCPVPDGVTPLPTHCRLQALPPPDPSSHRDPIPLFQGLRRVEPRNTANLFAAFNFDNFWDGRARHDSNGGSVFGPTDPQFHVYINNGTFSGTLSGATNGHFRPDLKVEDPEIAAQPVRIRFSSLASLATGPALSDFEMSFAGRNWAKLGKKLLQFGVVPLANQLVSPSDSVLGPFSNNRAPTASCLTCAVGKPGLNISYPDLIKLAFRRDLWANMSQHLNGAPAPCTNAVNGMLTPARCDPFDGYVLTIAGGPASLTNTNQFTQMEANMALFFGQSLQAWQTLLVPDDSPFDRFMDANPNAAFAVAQPGEQATLPPDQVPELVGPLTLVPGFGADEIFGFDIFSGANLTAALPRGSARNPEGMGSNPFLRTGRCMLCHAGPEQSDHTNNVNAGLMLSDTEFEFPPPPPGFTAPPGSSAEVENAFAEPTGPFRVVTGIFLAEEVEENAQDGVELELRNFSTFDDPSTPWDDRQIAFPGAFSFQDNGVYNIGVRPTREDIMRGGNDAFGWPLSIAALALKNLAGRHFEPCDTPGDRCTGPIPNFNPALGVGGGLFEETEADQRINPGLQMEPAFPLLPQYLAPWVNNLPAGELHPQIDELSVAPNTVTEPVGGPTIEFGEILFGSDTNCATWDPAAFGAGPPNFGYGPLCPTAQSAIPNNMDPPLNGTWPFQNRVARDGAVKVPQLRNVELTGPYFHTGSYLTLRQVVDFYVRGGDFPLTNAEDRDPNLVDITLQAFGFGATDNIENLVPELQDGFPDTLTRYGPMPDRNPPGCDADPAEVNCTPEPAASSQEQAKVALVKFLISLTDPRVKFERAPFDHPEIFVPLDGTAPDNGSLAGPVAGGRDGFLNNLANGMFRQVPAVGAAGNATPLKGFLGVTNNPSANCVSEISHFCR
jgi:cytochrome c peroxidase